MCACIGIGYSFEKKRKLDKKGRKKTLTMAFRSKCCRLCGYYCSKQITRNYT
jgi:hypothetical protein